MLLKLFYAARWVLLLNLSLLLYIWWLHTQLSVLRYYYIRFREPEYSSHFPFKLRPIMTSSSDFNIKNLEKSKSVNSNSTSRCDNRRQLEKSTSFFSPDNSIRSGKKKNHFFKDIEWFFARSLGSCTNELILR